MYSFLQFFCSVVWGIYPNPNKSLLPQFRTTDCFFLKYSLLQILTNVSRACPYLSYLSASYHAAISFLFPYVIHLWYLANVYSVDMVKLINSVIQIQGPSRHCQVPQIGVTWPESTNQRAVFFFRFLVVDGIYNPMHPKLRACVKVPQTVSLQKPSTAFDN